MFMRNLLFSDGELRDFLENRKKEINEEIQNQPPNYILNVSLSDFCSYLVQKYSLEPPMLNVEGITVDQNEKNVDVSRDPNRWVTDRSRPLYLKGTKFTYFIPFSGNPELFKYKPSSFTINPPEGTVTDQELCISFEGIDQKTEDIKREFDRRLTEIKKWLDWLSKDIGGYNETLTHEIETKVKARREKLLKDRGLVAELGFPLKRREDAPSTYSVPTIRRKITPKPSASIKSYKPEPVLDMEEYERILQIVNNMALVMERSPRAFQIMREEDIRQHFLVQLNGQYEGQATGETFNFEGKTDILIRIEGKNIFIAECTFWKGERYLTEKIDQLLRYATWRDTKTAILVFNRNKDLSNVISQIPDIVKKHPNFKKSIEYKSETGFRFVLHHRDDKNRELYLTVLIFWVPT